MDLKEILKKYGFNEKEFFFYGDRAIKIEKEIPLTKQGKLVLITSTSPTKYGEGKTTLAISLSDALNKLGTSAVAALREPSLGPVFGIKGGACGGGCARIVPEDFINLHFTGDIHAVTTANNLLSAIIDDHIYQGNELNINPQSITHERCMDLNERSLRNVSINGVNTHFNITTASEMMAILCLSTSKEDLKKHLENILVGYTYDQKEVFVKDLGCVNALALLLEDALKPNLVKTLENNLALVHGGPFANIAHGTCSLLSIFYGLTHFSYTLVETGFGSDMGALKFYDLLTRKYPELTPDVVLLNTTIQSLKQNGEGNLEKGLLHLEYHIKNMEKYTNQLLVVLNKHSNDLDSEIELVQKEVERLNISFSVSTGYLDGSDGSIEAAKKMMALANEKPKKITYSYNLTDSLPKKIEKFCKTNYGAKEILYTPNALEKIKLIEKSKWNDLPICVCKTQYSITDNAKVLGYPKNFTMTVSDCKLFSGAGFITVYFGKVLAMPGLGKDANYLHM